MQQFLRFLPVNKLLKPVVSNKNCWPGLARNLPVDFCSFRYRNQQMLILWPIFSFLTVFDSLIRFTSFRQVLICANRAMWKTLFDCQKYNSVYIPCVTLLVCMPTGSLCAVFIKLSISTLRHRIKIPVRSKSTFARQ